MTCICQSSTNVKRRWSNERYASWYFAYYRACVLIFAYSILYICRPHRIYGNQFIMLHDVKTADAVLLARLKVYHKRRSEIRLFMLSVFHFISRPFSSKGRCGWYGDDCFSAVRSSNHV